MTSRRTISLFIIVWAIGLFGQHNSIAQNTTVAPSLILQRGHSGAVLSLQFNNDNTWLVSTDIQGDVKLWDLTTHREVRTLIHSSIRFNSLQFSQTEELALRDVPISVIFDPKNKWIAIGSINNPVKMWELSTGSLLRSLPNSDGMRSLALSPQGSLLAGITEDGTVAVWDTASWGELKRFPVEKPEPSGLELFGSPGVLYASNRSIAFDDKGTSLVAVDKRRRIKRWDTSTWNISEIPYESNKVVFSIFDLSASGSIVATADFGNSQIQIWSATSGKRISSFKCHSSGATAIRLSDDGKWLATVSTNGELVIWDTTKATKVYQTSYPSGFPLGAISTVGFNSGTTWLAVGSANGIIDLYHTDSVASLPWLKRHTLSGQGSMQYQAVFDDDDTLITVADADGAIKSWDLVKGVQVERQPIKLTSPRGLMMPLGLKFNRRGDYYLTNDFTGKVEVGKLSSGGNVQPSVIFPIEPQSYVLNISSRGALVIASRTDGLISIWDTQSGEKRKDLQIPERALTATFSPDDKKVFYGSTDGSVYCYQTDGQRPQIKLATLSKSVQNIVASPNSMYVAVGTASGHVVIFNAVDGSSTDLPWRPELRTSVFAFTPDNKSLLIAGVDRKVYTWDVGLKKYAEVIFEQPSNVSGLFFSGTGKWLATTGEDGMLRIWDVKSWKHSLTLATFANTNDWLAITPDGLFDGSADALQQVSWRIGNTNETVPLDAFYTDFYYPGLLSDLRAGNMPKATIDIATALQLPAIRTMLKQQLARIEKRDEGFVICFQDEPTTLNISLLSNGQPISVAGFRYEPADATCRYRKLLPDVGNQVELISSIKISQSAGEAEWQGTESDTTGSTLHVLTVGITDYPAASGAKTLPFSVKGAKAVENFFIAQRDGGRHPFASVRIWPHLYDAQATRSAIRGRLADLAKEIKPEDVVFLFLSGHGVVPAGQEMFYFVPADGRMAGLDEYRTTGINTAMLAEALRNIPARRVVLIIDACQAGGAVESLGKIGKVKAEVEGRRESIKNGPSAAPQKPQTGVQIIAAAAPLQYALQSEKVGNSVLVTALLEALKTQHQSADGKVWVSKVVAKIKQRAPEISLNTDRSSSPLIQSPLIESMGVDFPLAVGNP